MRQSQYAKYAAVKKELEQKGFILCSNFVGYNPAEKQLVTCLKCGYTTTVSINNPQCPNCLKKPMSSIREDDIWKMLRERNVVPVRNYHLTVPDKSYYLELDLYIPSLKIAFECNGPAYHNESQVYNSYHRNKTIECLKQGIKLFHIWTFDANSDIEELIDGVLGIKPFQIKGLDKLKSGDLISVSRDISPIAGMWMPEGFTFLYETPSFRYWVSPEKKSLLSALKLKPDTILDGSRFEGKDMKNQGIYKIFDSGSLVYRKD